MGSTPRRRFARRGRTNPSRSTALYYISNCYNFWVWAPSGAEHDDIDGLRTNYCSWSGRGGCRLEETAFVLSKSLAGFHYPILVTQPVGDAPALTVRDAFDRMLVYCQRQRGPHRILVLPEGPRVGRCRLQSVADCLRQSSGAQGSDGAARSRAGQTAPGGQQCRV